MNKILNTFEVSKIRQIALKMREYEDGINFTIGEPGQDVPKEIKDYMSEIVETLKLGYAPTGGVIELRKKVSEYYNQYFGGDYTFENVTITIGATEGISTFSRCLIEEGDEVIMPTPSYPGYAPNIRLQKGVEVYVDTEKDGFKVKAEVLEKYITNKTKAIILTFPNNPTGLCLDKEEMDKIVELVKKYGIYLLCDEIYAALTFNKFESIAQYSDIRDKVVILSGFSKSHSMTGYRIGYMIASKDLTANFIKLSQYTTTGVPTVSQYGAIRALEICPTREEAIKENLEILDYMKKGLEKIGFKVIKPEGAFYLFVKYKHLIDIDSVSFCEDVLEKTHIGIVPGECFKVEGYFRMSVTRPKVEIDEALRRLEIYVKDLNV